MAQPRPVSLQTFVYRTLTLRLALMAAVIGLLTCVAVYVAERQNLRSMVVEETRAEIQLLIARTLQIIKDQGGEHRAAFHRALEERLSVQVKPRDGEFVYVCFYETAAQESEERIADAYALIDPVVQFARAQPRVAPENGETARVVMLGDRLHVFVVTPLTDPLERTLGYAQAVFAPSEAARLAFQDKLRRSVVLALLIVVAASGLLYPVILRLVGKLTLLSRNLLAANLDALSLLASAIAKRDSDTDLHNFRVTLYAARLAEALRLPDSAMQTLIKGAFLHDVGKIGIRDDILLKAGGLDAEEFALMQEHVQHGLDIIQGSVWLNDAALVVGAHHEKFDGSGYPGGLAGKAIPLSARIFAVADVFDALTSRRPYKTPLSYEASMAIIRAGSGSHFDPEIVDAFAALAEGLHRAYAGQDDQRLREELQAVVARYFSEGEMLLD